MTMGLWHSVAQGFDPDSRPEGLLAVIRIGQLLGDQEKNSRKSFPQSASGYFGK